MRSLAGYPIQWFYGSDMFDAGTQVMLSGGAQTPVRTCHVVFLWKRIHKLSINIQPEIIREPSGGPTLAGSPAVQC